MAGAILSSVDTVSAFQHEVDWHDSIPGIWAKGTVLLQLLYVPQPSGLSRELQWSTYVWRRGTVPIWWGVEIKSGGVGEATIVVSNAKPYRGTKRLVHKTSGFIP